MKKSISYLIAFMLILFVLVFLRNRESEVQYQTVVVADSFEFDFPKNWTITTEDVTTENDEMSTNWLIYATKNYKLSTYIAIPSGLMSLILSEVDMDMSALSILPDDAIIKEVDTKKIDIDGKKISISIKSVEMEGKLIYSIFSTVKFDTDNRTIFINQGCHYSIWEKNKEVLENIVMSCRLKAD